MTLIDMIQFMSDWFDFEESENGSCVVSEGEVANCGSSVQECVEIEENDDQFESSIFENLTQQMVEALGLEVVDKTHIESTNLVVKEIDKTTESNIFDDLVTIPLTLVGQSVGKLDIGFEDTKVRLGLVDDDFVWDLSKRELEAFLARLSTKEFIVLEL